MATTFLMPVGGNRRPGRAATSIDPTARRPHRPATLCAFAAAACALLVTPSFELDLNSFRVQHGRPPLSQSIRLTSAAYSHAQSVSQYDNVSITRAFGNAWMCLPDPPPKCRLWLHNGGLCHPHVGALRCASREYAAPWLRSHLGGRRTRQALLIAGTRQLIQR